MSAAHAAAMIAERSAGEMRLCASEMSMAEIAGGTSLETTHDARQESNAISFGRLESRFKRSVRREGRTKQGRSASRHQLKLPHSKHKRPRARSAHGVKPKPHSSSSAPRVPAHSFPHLGIWLRGEDCTWLNRVEAERAPQALLHSSTMSAGPVRLGARKAAPGDVQPR